MFKQLYCSIGLGLAELLPKHLWVHLSVTMDVSKHLGLHLQLNPSSALYWKTSSDRYGPLSQLTYTLKMYVSQILIYSWSTAYKPHSTVFCNSTVTISADVLFKLQCSEEQWRRACLWSRSAGLQQPL